MEEYEQAVFISYAWGGENEAIVDQIDQALQERGLRIIRDKRELGYKGSIRAFMERVGQGNCVIAIISDKYLRSPSCMFELVEIAEGKQFHDRIFPIVLSNAEIYDPVKRLEYVKYWEMKRGELAQAMKEVDPANLQGIREDMDLYDRIRGKISGLTSILKDMNTLTPDLHRDSDFSELYTGIERRIAAALGVLKPETGESPYMGLRYFDTSDAALFYGRETLTDELLARMQKESCLAIVGASGSGKSSVARAGLIPAWKAATMGMVHVIVPTAHPLESLAASLTRQSESVTATSTLIDDLMTDTRSLRLYVRKMLSGSGVSNLLLVIDQFEEAFTLCKDPTERKAFIENLLSLTDEDAEYTVARVVITLRADFYHHCAEYEGLRLMLEKHQVYIGTLTTDELREAITAPAEKNGWDFQPGLVDLILADVGTEPGALPLLSHALLETWKRRQGRTLTLQGYHEAGGVKKAITQTAESVYDKLSPAEQTVARNIFLRLTEVGQGVQNTRRRVKLDDLAPAKEQEVVARVLKTLTDARLVTAEQDSAEVAHEALIREWGTLRKWLDQDRSFLLWQQRLQDAMHQWETSGHSEDEGLRGALLRESEMWLQERRADLNQAEQVFILFCLALREHNSQSLDQAQEYYRQALELDATLAEIHYYLHLLLLEKGRLDEALQEHNQAVVTKPELAIIPPGYVVVKILSASGPFITYQAKDMQEKQDNIIFKVLKRAYDRKEVLEVLRGAIDQSQKLEHPSIVKIKTFDELRNKHYIVREYVSGRSLRELIDEEGPLSLKMSSDILVQLCSILNTIHEQGIVYGNLKPTNIYWSDTKIQLTDLGLGAMATSGDYLPPERSQGQEALQTDVFSLGAIFYEMLTRRKPSSGFSESRLDSALELVLECACASTAEDRYPSIDIFLDELSQIIPRQLTAKNVRWNERLVALAGQVLREITKRSWPWALLATLGLGLLAPLFGEAIVLRQTVRTASLLFTLIFILATLLGWLSFIIARKVRHASIAAYGGAMGVLLSFASGLLWLRGFVFQMPDAPIGCDPDYLQPLGLGQIANLRYMLEVIPAYLTGSLITSLFVFAAIAAMGVLARWLGWQYKSGFFIGFLFWLTILILVARSLSYGWFGCF
jgi:serine/threonine protein kinase